VVVYITDRLKNSYGGQIGDSKKYAYYKRLQKEHMTIWQAEIQAKELYQDLRMHYIKSNAYKPYVSEIAKEGLKELQPALEKYQTSRLIFFAYVAKLAQYTSINDFKTASALADEAIAVFRKKPYDAERLIHSFFNQKLICHIQLKEYEKGQAVIAETLSVHVEGSLSWFKTLEHASILAFHTKKYEEAYNLYQQAKAHPQFMTLELRNLEIWHLYKAYLYFLIAAGKVGGLTVKSAELDDFRMGRFVNDVTIFGRDSAGMNISVLIVQLAVNLLEGKFGKVIDSIDALTKFRQRHVSKANVLYRHNLFIKMVSKIPRSGFARQAAKKLTEVPYRHLKNAPIMTDGQSFQSEIIPLEDMWEILVNMLKNEK
jgi:hypothetical protein